MSDNEETIKILFIVERDMKLEKGKNYVLIKSHNFVDALIFEEI